MKFMQKDMGGVEDASSAKHTATQELIKLSVLAVMLIAVIYMAVGFGSDLIISRISFETEQRIFASASPKGAKEDDSEKAIHATLDKMRSYPGVPPYDYRIVIMKNDMPNAFAFPGGTIGVTTGLIEKLKDEDETALAFVLGHELGHFKSRDHLRGLGRAIGVTACMAILFNRSNANIISNSTSLALSRKYSREREEAADLYGADLVLYAYDNTENMARFFEIMLKSDKTPDWAFMLATHPSPKKRIKKIHNYVERKMKK